MVMINQFEEDNMKVTDKKILTPAIAISVAVLSGTVYYGVQLNQKNNSNTTYAEV